MTTATSPQPDPGLSALAARGWQLFPCRPRDKTPLVTEWQKIATTDRAQIRAWAHKYPACNWGLATGTASGVVVIDIDGAEGRASLADLERQGFMLPATLTVNTGRTDGGEHRYYRQPSGIEIRNDQSGKIGPHIDVRGTGGFVVCPPAVHASGKQYHFIDPDTPVADLPVWVIERLTVRPPTLSATAQASPQSVGKGSRTNTLVSLAGTMQQRGVSREAIEAALLAENAAKCDPPLDENRVKKLARDICRRYPNPVPSTPPHDEETTATGTPDWPALPAAALFGLAGDIVRTIEPHSEADPAAILIQALTAVGNLIGPQPHCIVESTRHALTLCPVLVGETSKARKGTSWGHVDRLGARVDPKWAAERVTSGLSSAEGLISEVRDDPGIDRRLLVVQSEYGSVLRIMAREGNGLSPLLRSAWDTGNLRTLVKNNPLKSTGAHISVIGHITRLELLRYLSDTEQHNGFANRLLWCCARRSKCLPEGGSVPEAEIVPLAQVLTSVIEWAREKGDCEIRRDETARGLWAAVYPRLSAGRAGLLGAATSRAEAQVLRLSAIYAVLDRSAVVRVEHLRAALAVWDYCFASARYIFGDATGDPVADRIREALQGVGAEGLTRTQIRDLLGRHASADRIAQALTQLAALGIASCEMVSTEGRSIELWTATEATKATEG